MRLKLLPPVKPFGIFQKFGQSDACSGGKVSTDWISLQDSHAGGGAVFYAGRNSTNVSGNTGWIFTAPKDNGFMSLAY